MRPIIITSRKVPNNSFEMRGVQIAGVLKNVALVAPGDLMRTHDSIIIWVRRALDENRLKKLTARGCIHILDPLDRIDELQKGMVIKNIHGVIYPSKTQYKDSEKYPQQDFLRKYFLLHHYDPRLKSYAHDHFELGYWGYRTSANHVFNLIPRKNRWTSARSNEFPPDDFFKRVSCHYSVRDKKRGFDWRPTTKISTAAACGANIICSRDRLSLELLPPDYPYFVDGWGIDATRAVIEHARSTFGTDVWRYGLACMERVKKQTSIGRCAKLYTRIIDDLQKRYS